MFCSICIFPGQGAANTSKLWNFDCFVIYQIELEEMWYMGKAGDGIAPPGCGLSEIPH